ncbi:hypothetical protein KIW84_013670 [Lathyrus oleraceus]|uniref:Reverse transcriptase Ty1/copia-type domain-containing protein n=1 Tax=Pisum sativum TaxID=3888 RepID=A0A9D5BKY2_PEA|nr:hypothetical protein KIW84_013670 [Pisum sativum]
MDGPPQDISLVAGPVEEESEPAPLRRSSRDKKPLESQYDPSLFLQRTPRGIMVLLVYVDDIVVTDLVQLAGLTNATPIDIPMEVNVKYIRDEGDLLDDPIQYRKLVVILKDWSPQVQIVVMASIVNVFHQVWTAMNLLRFEANNTRWKTCITNLSSQAKLVGNHTFKLSNSSISNFTILKKFDITIHPRKTSTTKDVLWHPPLQVGLNVLLMAWAEAPLL